MVQAILATTDAQLEKTRAAARQDLEDFEATFPGAEKRCQTLGAPCIP